MIEKYGEGFVMYCDGSEYGANCGLDLELDTDDFNEAIRMAKEEGWRPVKIDDDWKHFCPGCLEAERHMNRVLRRYKPQRR